MNSNIYLVLTSTSSMVPSLEVHAHYENVVMDVLIDEKIDIVDILESLKIVPKAKFRLNIPLCHMIFKPIVRPIFQTYINKLEANFVRGYHD